MHVYVCVCFAKLESLLIVLASMILMRDLLHPLLSLTCLIRLLYNASLVYVQAKILPNHALFQLNAPP